MNKNIEDNLFNKEELSKEELIKKHRLEGKETNFSRYTKKKSLTSGKPICYTIKIYNNAPEIMNMNKPAIQPTKADDKPLDK